MRENSQDREEKLHKINQSWRYWTNLFLKDGHFFWILIGQKKLFLSFFKIHSCKFFGKISSFFLCLFTKKELILKRIFCSWLWFLKTERFCLGQFPTLKRKNLAESFLFRDSPSTKRPNFEKHLRKIQMSRSLQKSSFEIWDKI